MVLSKPVRRNPRSTLAAVVLAAGAGRRMGGPKALLPWRGTTLLQATLAALPPDADRIVVLDPSSAIIAESSLQAENAGARVVPNPDAARGMLSSVRTALDALAPGTTHVMLMPVDHPGIRAETIAALAFLATQHPDAIVVPSHAGRRGHPGIFPSSLFDALRNAPDDEGARWLLHQNAERVVHLEVDDPWTVRDLDTAEDLQQT